MAQAALLSGTLDLLILKPVSLGRLHGYGVLLRIEQISGEALQIEQGSLYPALNRLGHQELLKPSGAYPRTIARRGSTSLSRKGQRRLREEINGWLRFVDVVGTALLATPSSE